MRLLARLGLDDRGSASMSHGLFAGFFGLAAIVSIQTLAVGLVHLPERLI